MEIIDYKNNLIHFNERSFPFIVVNEGVIEHIISVLDLERQLFHENGDYISDTAEWLDEQITYFVQNELELQQSPQKIYEEIYG